jgi:hypothetical protein
MSSSLGSCHCPPCPSPFPLCDPFGVSRNVSLSLTECPGELMPFSIAALAAALTSCTSFPLVVRLFVDPAAIPPSPLSCPTAIFSPVGFAWDLISIRSGRSISKSGDDSRRDSSRKAVADATWPPSTRYCGLSRQNKEFGGDKIHLRHIPAG